MANQSTTGFGFRAANRLGGTPSIQGQTKYQLQTAPGVALMKNDPASIQDAGNTGFIQDASFATTCLLYTSPSPRDVEESRMPSSA